MHAEDAKVNVRLTCGDFHLAIIAKWARFSSVTRRQLLMGLLF